MAMAHTFSVQAGSLVPTTANVSEIWWVSPSSAGNRSPMGLGIRLGPFWADRYLVAAAPTNPARLSEPNDDGPSVAAGQEPR